MTVHEKPGRRMVLWFWEAKKVERKGMGDERVDGSEMNDGKVSSSSTVVVIV